MASLTINSYTDSAKLTAYCIYSGPQSVHVHVNLLMVLPWLILVLYVVFTSTDYTVAQSRLYSLIRVQSNFM